MAAGNRLICHRRGHRGRFRGLLDPHGESKLIFKRCGQRFRNVVNRRRLAGWAKEFNDPRLRIPALDFRQEQLSHAKSTIIGAHTGQ